MRNKEKTKLYQILLATYTRGENIAGIKFDVGAMDEFIELCPTMVEHGHEKHYLPQMSFYMEMEQQKAIIDEAMRYTHSHYIYPHFDYMRASAMDDAFTVYGIAYDTARKLDADTAHEKAALAVHRHIAQERPWVFSYEERQKYLDDDGKYNNVEPELAENIFVKETTERNFDKFLENFYNEVSNTDNIGELIELYNQCWNSAGHPYRQRMFFTEIDEIDTLLREKKIDYKTAKKRRKAVAENYDAVLYNPMRHAISISFFMCAPNSSKESFEMYKKVYDGIRDMIDAGADDASIMAKISEIVENKYRNVEWIYNDVCGFHTLVRNYCEKYGVK